MSSRDESERKLASMAEMGVSREPHPSVSTFSVRSPAAAATQMERVLGLTTRKLVPSAVRWPTPARMKPVTVSSSPITPTSLVPSLIFSGKSFWRLADAKVRNTHLRVILTRYSAVVPLKRVLCLKMATQHLQGLVPRKTATADPKTPAEFFNHVAENVRVNEDLTALRCVQPAAALGSLAEG